MANHAEKLECQPPAVR